MHIYFTKEQKRKLAELRDKIGASTKSEVIRRALALLDAVEESPGGVAEVIRATAKKTKKVAATS